MFGEKKKIGVLGNQAKEKKIEKWMWHLWGEPDNIIGEFKVVATNKNSNTKITLVPATMLSDPPSPANGAPQHLPTNIVFPSKGIWKIDVL